MPVPSYAGEIVQRRCGETVACGNESGTTDETRHGGRRSGPLPRVPHALADARGDVIDTPRDSADPRSPHQRSTPAAAATCVSPALTPGPRSRARSPIAAVTAPQRAGSTTSRRANPTPGGARLGERPTHPSTACTTRRLDDTGAARRGHRRVGSGSIERLTPSSPDGHGGDPRDRGQWAPANGARDAAPFPHYGVTRRALVMTATAAVGDPLTAPDATRSVP